MTERYIKASTARLDYTFNWNDGWLSTGETISTFSLSINPNTTDGMQISTQSSTATAVTVWVSGGKHGVDYWVSNRVTTSALREDVRTIMIKTWNPR